MREAPDVLGAGTDRYRGRARKLAAPAVVGAVLASAICLSVPAGALAAHTPPYAIKPKPTKPTKPKPTKPTKPKPTGPTKPSKPTKSAKPLLGPVVTTNVAIALQEKPIYEHPSTKAPVLRTLRYYTPDSEALQTYRIIATVRVGHTAWDQIQVPMRPNGHTGWVKRGWLGPPITSHTVILVERWQSRLYVYKYGKLEFTAPVGVGKPTTPTPPGHFWVAEGFPSEDAFYGPWAFGTTDYAVDTDFPDDSIVGLHGTNAPKLIPGDPSHGCVRLKDADILKLKKYVSIGTAVWIV
jgi:lipoprotein-anchoring transpeptidase ErfK/SrfK